MPSKNGRAQGVEQEMVKTSIYLRTDDYRNLRIKLLQKNGSANVAAWIRQQIDNYLKQA